MTILETLKAGPASYAYLRALHGEQVEYQIRKHLKSGEIWRRALEGAVVYCLPLPPIDDEIIHDERVITGQCVICGEPLYRRSAKYCSRACHTKSKVKQKPPCKRCGKPVSEMKSQYCSQTCRHIRRYLRWISAVTP